MNTALIVTTYNQPQNLGLFFRSLQKQIQFPAELVVVDDGSDYRTRVVVDNWVHRFPFTVKYVWQPDVSFRAARARNLGVLTSSSDHIVFVDGDCLLPPSFIQNHRRLAHAGKLVAGGRYLLSKKTTKKIKQLCNQEILSNLFAGIKFLCLPLGPLRDLKGENWTCARTCNLGLMRVDFENIGGFDEAFVGWGREDSDLVVRSLRRGCSIRSGRLAACVAHIWHDKVSRSDLVSNEEAFQRTLASNHSDPVKTVLSSQ